MRSETGRCRRSSRAELGLPALGPPGLAVIVLGAACWVIRSDARAGRLSRVLLAWRGNASCLAADAVPARAPAAPPGPPRRS
ncbi:MAG: hypothetical protein ACRDPY_37340 [Streptosporangiaceae bacterium]